MTENRQCFLHQINLFIVVSVDFGSLSIAINILSFIDKVGFNQFQFQFKGLN